MFGSNKGFLQISFAWLFAIIVGAVILFLAIYASTQVLDTGESASSAETARQIGILLNPLETGFESGSTTVMSLPSETRIFNRCNNRGDFGNQLISVSQKSFGGWSDSGISVSFSNKYIFSEDTVQGQNFYLFSKPFNFPFKVADVIYMTSSEETYCFEDAPERVKNEIGNLNQGNLLTEECPETSIEVCFSYGSECDIEVDERGREGEVEKRGENVKYYSDALMYAAVFSDAEVYECQLERLMQKGSMTSDLYADKSDFVSQRACDSGLGSNLNQLSNLEKGFESSFELNQNMIEIVENLEDKNDFSGCKLW